MTGHHSAQPRRISVKGRDGIAVTVVVTAYRGHVWLSIAPPFTWEAIMEPTHVDQLVYALELARKESSRPVTVDRTQAEGSRIVREIERGPVTPENKTMGNGTSVVRGNA